MAAAFSNVGSFVRGCLGRDGRLLLEFSDRELTESRTPHSFFLLWDNGKLGTPIKALWSTAALVFPDWPDVEFVAVGAAGELLWIRHDGTQLETQLFGPGRSPQRGPLRGAAVIGGAMYVVGAAHQVLRIAQDWSVTDISIPPTRTQAQPDSVGLEAVQGFGSDEIYAVGWEGEIWRYDGQQWQRVGGPTNVILTALVCAPDDKVYIVGQEGALLVGRHDRWTPIITAVRENLWGACWFFDSLQATSMEQMFALEQGELRSVELPGEPKTFFWLDSNTRAMLSVGADDVLLLLKDRMLKLL